MPTLSVTHLKKSFQYPVLRDLSFSIEPSSVTGFLGLNGSGKTTTLRCLLGLSHFDQGEVQFFDGQSLCLSVLSQVGFLSERMSLPPYLTGEEVLLLYAQLSYFPSRFLPTYADLKSRVRFLLKKLKIYSAKDQIVRHYSKGMLKKLGIAQAFVHKPKLVLLDEPFEGLDPSGRFLTRELIKESVQNGASVFFSSHLFNDIEKLCQNLVVLRKGVIFYQGSINAFLNKEPTYYCIGYSSPTQIDHKKTIRIQHLSECQKMIDQLRKQECVIWEVKKDKQSLEQKVIQLLS